MSTSPSGIFPFPNFPPTIQVLYGLSHRPTASNLRLPDEALVPSPREREDDNDGRYGVCQGCPPSHLRAHIRAPPLVLAYRAATRAADTSHLRPTRYQRSGSLVLPCDRHAGWGGGSGPSGGRRRRSVRGRTAGVSGRWTAMTATSYKLKAVYHIGILLKGMSVVPHPRN